MTQPLYGLATEEGRVLRQLERNLAAAHKLRAPWRVRAAMVAGSAVVLEAIEAERGEER